MGGQSSVEEKCLLWSFSFQQRGLSCNARVCIPEQMLETVMANASLCAGASLGDSSGPTTGRDSEAVVSRSPGAWATLQEGFEGTGWQSPGKLEQQRQGEEAAWPTGSCFGLLDLLESLNAELANRDRLRFKGVIYQISSASASLLHCWVFGPPAEKEMKSYKNGFFFSMEEIFPIIWIIYFWCDN